MWYIFRDMPARGKRSTVIKVLLFLGLFSVVASGAFGADYTWSGGAGNGNWTDNGNWSGGPQYPGFQANDTATITIAAAVDVNAALPNAIDQLTIGDAVISIALTNPLSISTGAALLSVDTANSLSFTGAGALTIGTVTIADTTTGTVTFNAPVSVTSAFNSGTGSGDINILAGGTITPDTTFSNAGSVTFGDSGDITTFAGGLDTTTVTGGTTIFGTVTTTGTRIDFGAVTLTGASVIDSAGGVLNIASVTGGGNTLGLDGGAAGVITVSGVVDDVATLTVTNSAGTTFQGSIGAGTAGAVTLSATAGTISFQGATDITTLTTASQGYNVSFSGTTTVTDDANFLNTGTVLFDGGATHTFNGGLATAGNVSNPGGTTINGTIETSADQIDLGAISLTGASVISTGAGTAGDINLVAVNGAEDLTLTSGTGLLNLDGDVGVGTNLTSFTANGGTIDLAANADIDTSTSGRNDNLSCRRNDSGWNKHDRCRGGYVSNLSADSD